MYEELLIYGSNLVDKEYIEKLLKEIGGNMSIQLPNPWIEEGKKIDLREGL